MISIRHAKPAHRYCVAGAVLIAGMLMAAGGCAPQARIVASSPPADFQPHTCAPIAGATACLSSRVPHRTPRVDEQPVAPGCEFRGLAADVARASSRRTLDIGFAADGRALALEVFGSGPRTVLVLGGIHGDETRSVEVARFLADYLAANSEALGGKTVAVLVNANPTGAANRTRPNARGVDLNRNFPASNWRPGTVGRRDSPGPAPASEPETQAILRAMELLRPACIISLHTAAREGTCNNFDGPAEGLARLMAAQNGYPVLANIGHPTPGSLGSWAGADRGIAVLTLELPEGRPGAECWQRNRGALLDVISADVFALPGCARIFWHTK